MWFFRCIHWITVIWDASTNRPVFRLEHLAVIWNLGIRSCEQCTSWTCIRSVTRYCACQKVESCQLIDSNVWKVLYITFLSIEYEVRNQMICSYNKLGEIPCLHHLWALLDQHTNNKLTEGNENKFANIFRAQINRGSLGCSREILCWVELKIDMTNPLGKYVALGCGISFQLSLH